MCGLYAPTSSADARLRTTVWPFVRNSSTASGVTSCGPSRSGNAFSMPISAMPQNRLGPIRDAIASRIGPNRAEAGRGSGGELLPVLGRTAAGTFLREDASVDDQFAAP